MSSSFIEKETRRLASGVTVRISREAISFQRALVQAGILDESDIIVG